jgi:hypothetical protein
MDKSGSFASILGIFELIFYILLHICQVLVHLSNSPQPCMKLKDGWLRAEDGQSS